ncbi:MAG: glycerol-3-phosphate dehydrogenase [Terriglobia bacterium]
MKRDLEALSGILFDLVVIGGGINGAATAREAALRGLKVALIEAQDFASGTSSRSSKLIHGGLRYLAQGNFKLVREARRERRLLARLAPHLVQPLPFLLPIYRGDPYSPLKMRFGLTLYDWLGNLGLQDRHHFYNSRETLRRVPRLRGEELRAGAVFYDSLTDDARLSVEYALDAAEHGAVVANYTEVKSFIRQPRSRQVTSAEAVDHVTRKKYEVSGRFWVNAAGPWVDRVRALVPGFAGSKTIRMTKGTHVILPCVCDRWALFAAIPPGERIFLMMPWQGHSLLGTTDTDYDGDPGAVEPARVEIEYLLGALNRVLRQPVGTEEVIGSYAGVRALVVEPGRSPSANTREYRFHHDPWVNNMITICGGKLTTARALGDKLTDVVESELPAGSANANASEAPLPGGHTGPFQAFVEAATEEAIREFGIPSVAADRILRTYGSRWRSVLAPIRADGTLAEVLPGAPELLKAEVVFSIREEMAVTVEDFLLRRSGLNWMACAYPEVIPGVADIFAQEYGWDEELRSSAIARFERIIHRAQKVFA